MNAIRLTLISIFSLSFITACAPPKVALDQPLSSQSSSSITSPETAQQANAKAGKATQSATTVSSWDLSGAMAAKSAKKGWSASLNWAQQGPSQYQMRLYGPLGGGTVLVEKKGAVVTYIDGPNRLSSSNESELLQKQTGIRLPVRNLYYWARGLQAPGSVQSVSRDANGNLVTLTQNGYIITYAGYTAVGNVSLPTKIRVQGHDTTIKLVIKRWKI